MHTLGKASRVDCENSAGFDSGSAARPLRVTRGRPSSGSLLFSGGWGSCDALVLAGGSILCGYCRQYIAFDLGRNFADTSADVKDLRDSPKEGFRLRLNAVR